MTLPNSSTQQPALLGQGFVWQDLSVGQRFRTFRRTITETDLVNFISCTGMLEAIFIEKGYAGGAIEGRPVPGALTYTLIEGFILQTMIQGTGLAMLELTQKILLPVRHALMARNDATGFTRIVSHQQSLGQCRNYLAANYPNCELEAVASNSFAAHKAAEAIAA